GVYAFTVETLWSISSQRTDQLPVIEVVGHQWWWEVRYPEQEVVTANQITIPAGEPVQIRLMSEDVNHSFWVPELHGKLDMIPGRVNSFWIEAEEPGTYWGICAEFCGIQHANMYFLVIAVPPADYADWLVAQQEPPPAPASDLAQRGKTVYEEHDCAACHAIAGTDFAGQLGPDLTNLAARRRLAAGMLENNTENLTEWLLHPQQIKPGSLMPATVNVDAEELQALVAYLQTLE
ncbi:MAG: c-type cytochrome, partial [Caldilineaceae bacterium]|nr:c-type cytochrome [Caldilineaceae bacterium]